MLATSNLPATSRLVKLEQLKTNKTQDGREASERLSRDSLLHRRLTGLDVSRESEHSTHSSRNMCRRDLPDRSRGVRSPAVL